jgi:hypothetical protein
MLITYLDKFYNRKDIPWVKLIWSTHCSNGEVPHITKDRGSFWWRDVLKSVDQLRGIASCKVGDGKTVLFWSDVWNGHFSSKDFFLRKIQQGKPLLWYFINIENKIQKEQKHQLKTEQAIPRGREETTLKGEGETNYLKVFTISKTRGFLEPSNL